MSNTVWLMMFTLAAVIVIAVWQFVRVQRSKAMKSHSAMTEGVPHQRSHEGKTPGVSRQP